MLDGFIKKFVLCEKCDNPETVMKVKSVLFMAFMQEFSSEYDALAYAWS